ncbi:MAG: prepilin-type N-terminal cleavage/methylation domain-containing protein [Planctomycetaceae bacterium]|nr:MAG: prepilin-type N-terminal cleavage/methylation domain-containing protein [Planctomycetaceae bacterium]
MIRKPNLRTARSDGFTLVEMLIAMAVTLLLMAALGKGFAFIGESIRDSRVQVELTNDLRDVTHRLQEDLERCTTRLRPCVDQQEPVGYFVYYEGPVTDATSSLFLSTTDPRNPSPESRYGDFDDYLAFTVVATGDNWFTGVVPRQILDAKTAELAGQAYNASNFPGGPNDPIMIRSKYAEIIYFASPEYDPASSPANPQYLDFEGNGLPDRLKVHRRVLLIRPDLNLTTGLPEPRITALAAGGDWLTGMAAVHQQCDLSVRRVLNNGVATNFVAANSLADLAKPHNRFAHVRVPGAAIGIGADYTSMPILALGPAATVLTSAAGLTLGPPAMGSGSPVITPTNWAGFLRPEFVLGGNRIGEDVLVPSAVGFDVKIYDTLAPVITTANGSVVSNSDPGYREAMRALAAGNATAIPGDFVDLMYPVLAGGPIRGWQARRWDRLTAAGQEDAVFAPGQLRSQFAGLTGLPNVNDAYTASLYRSGKIVVDGTPAIRLFQPTFDTYTNHYERDGLQQFHPLGARWRIDSVGVADRGADGLGVLGIAPRETLPPFLSAPEAIRVTIRLEHQLNRQVRQLSVVHRERK